MNEYIEPYQRATLNVIEMMAFVKPLTAKPFIKKDKVARGDISGIISISGSKSGVMVISLSKGAICKIVGSMFGEEYTEINDEVKDAVGELTNMISGDARKILAEKGLTLEAGIPSIIVGKGHEISNLSNGQCLSIPFKVDAFPFVIEISFNKD
ncbi:MAG: chemotaxis protein CheX [Nitrospinae bacterium]|nr:chemotaxis protein CheX [Nitrospinota bacterium]